MKGLIQYLAHKKNLVNVVLKHTYIHTLLILLKIRLTEKEREKHPEKPMWCCSTYFQFEIKKTWFTILKNINMPLTFLHSEE